MENKRQKINVFNIILLILLILFSSFVIYQILRKIFGGSWTTESILTSLSIIIITSILIVAGFLINLARTIGKLESNVENIKESFIHLATDFKEHLSKHRT